MRYLVFLQLFVLFFSSFLVHLVTVACVELLQRPVPDKKQDTDSPFAKVTIQNFNAKK